MGKAMARLEQSIQMSIVDYLSYVVLGHKLIFSIPNEGKRSVALGTLMRRMGLRAGVADLCLVYDGRAHFMEVKAPEGRLTKTQEEFKEAALLAGAGWAVVRSIEDVERCLAIWNIPTSVVK
jgi:hypothetical protein